MKTPTLPPINEYNGRWYVCLAIVVGATIVALATATSIAIVMIAQDHEVHGGWNFHLEHTRDDGQCAKEK